jgi:hypothetical protein
VTRHYQSHSELAFAHNDCPAAGGTPVDGDVLGLAVANVDFVVDCLKTANQGTIGVVGIKTECRLGFAHPHTLRKGIVGG